MRIIEYPSSLLRKKAEFVSEEVKHSGSFHANLNELIRIAKLDGLGVAATQVGWGINLFVATVDENLKPTETPLIYINPQIVEESKEIAIASEGCLSFPELSLQVIRPRKIKWTYETLDGAKVEKVEEFSETQAGYHIRLVQHEVDHLRGILMIDKVLPSLRPSIDAWIKNKK